MKTNLSQNKARGYVSLLAVFTLSVFMLSMMIFAYQRATTAQGVQAEVQSQADYREKEEAILRSIVAITPNRAIRAMQGGSDSDQVRDALSWQGIFTDALAQSNARQSISPELLMQLGVEGTVSANFGDSDLGTITRIFTGVGGTPGVATGGLNRDLGAGFPPALNTTDTVINDDAYPIISDFKVYGGLASGEVALPTVDYPKFNQLPYPDINFGYSKPGELFVAKRNWWAFNLDLAGHDVAVTQLAAYQREFVLSIYEIPSQLPISASSFLALGTHGNGEAWDMNNITIGGNIFAGRARVDGNSDFTSLATRRGTQISTDSKIDGATFTGNPFAPGFREQYRIDNPTKGDFFPVSLASESGKAAFVSINRGKEFFDRFAHSEPADPLGRGDEIGALSPTTWDNYSVGALQCRMTLDITQCVSLDDNTLTELRFTYIVGNDIRRSEIYNLAQGEVEGGVQGLSAGYTKVADEGDPFDFPTPVDIAYGANGTYYYMSGVSGSIIFNDALMGIDPDPDVQMSGYYRPLVPFGTEALPDGKKCVAIYPERFQAFLAALQADGLDVNHSIAVNVNYHGSNNLEDPLNGNGSCKEETYGLIVKESKDLRAFTRGFSLVTNLRLHFGDHFNMEATTPPADFPLGAPYFPPASIFAPEKRYGVEDDPLAVELSGQVGSVASENAENPVRPLDATNVSGDLMAADQLTINLSPITHPAELPPITMMNWLILLEEKRAEFE